MTQNKAIQISGVVITFNEETNIERCLQSMQEVVDELVLVDSFSTDRTEEICKKYGVVWVQHAFGGYIEQKNYALQQASHDFVLSLDADEALSEKMKLAILRIKENWQADGYIFNRLNNYCGKWLRYAWYPDAKLRLWDRRKGKWGGVNPHDKVEMISNAEIKKAHADILHFPYKTLSEHTQQVQKFGLIAANAKFEKGKNANFIIHVILNPIFKFLKQYLLRGGFLDGYYGFLFCIQSSYLNFIKYSKLWELNQKK